MAMPSAGASITVERNPAGVDGTGARFIDTVVAWDFRDSKEVYQQELAEDLAEAWARTAASLRSCPPR